MTDQFRPLGYEQITSLIIAVGLGSIPAGATTALISVSGGDVSWRDDGIAPTASVGVPLVAGQVFEYSGTLSAIKFIARSASPVLDVSFYSSVISDGSGWPGGGLDVANEALQLIGNDMTPVGGQAPTFDNSPAGVALQHLYTPCVQAVGRQFGWDFARGTVALTLTANAAPFGWAFEYAYPGIELWQLVPATLADPNNPLPVNWSVGNTLVAGKQTKVIWTNQANAHAIYNSAPSESTWDPGFRAAVVRLLASELAMALTGRPDTAQSLLQASMEFSAVAQTRSD